MWAPNTMFDYVQNKTENLKKKIWMLNCIFLVEYVVLDDVQTQPLFSKVGLGSRTLYPVFVTAFLESQLGLYKRAIDWNNRPYT